VPPMNGPLHNAAQQGSLATIGDILLARGIIKEEDLRQAERLQREAGGLLSQALLRVGSVSEEDLLKAQSEQLNLSLLNADDVSPNDGDYDRAIEALALTARWLRTRHCAIWQETEKGPVMVVAQNILDPEIRETLETRCYKAGLELKDYLASNQTVERALSHIREVMPDMDGPSDDDAARLREMAEEAPVIDYVNRVFSTALRENASDIHIEPFEHKFQVRYRIDGVLHTKQVDPKSQFDAVASRIKLLSGMDIAERRLPQDGRQSIRFAGQDIDLRVGSGKSTTLYRGLRGLNDGIRKIITIEDPVEYDMDGIIQIQTNASIGYTFAKGLRAILRQDPDIIMVGEIRDGETATIAAQAALTGHLVLSTLHTNSALAAVARLIDIGLEPYMVISAVRGLVAQRLVRRLCTNCAVPVKKPEGEDMIWSMIKSGTIIDPTKMAGKANWHESKGCEACSHTGYQGRLAIFETVKLDDPLSEAILKGASLQKLLSVAREQGFMTLIEDGILKARSGVTSLSEVFRVCGANMNNVDITGEKADD